MLLYLIPLAATTGTPVKEVIDAQTISLIVGVVIPLVVGLFSKVHASSGLKSLINAAFSAIAGALTAYASTGFSGTDWKTLVTSILSTWVVSVATYYGVYKPTGVAGSVIARTPNFGLGSPPVVETPDKGVEDAA